MTYRNNNILAIVPARSGSKGIHKKNIAKLKGIPLLGYVGNLLKELSFIDYSFLSTDSVEFQSIGIRHGISCPSLRPKHLASDTALSIDVWIHAWNYVENMLNKKFDISILLEPTSPLRKASDIKQSIDLLIDSNSDSLVTVSKNSSQFSPEKTFLISDDNCLKKYINNDIDYSIRQLIPNYYHKNGICYAAKRKTILEEKNIINLNTYALEISRPVINIDDPIDLEIADFLLTKYEKSS